MFQKNICCIHSLLLTGAVICIASQTDKSGCATQIVNVTEFELDKNMYADSFMVTAELEEYGTGKLTQLLDIVHLINSSSH